MLIVLKNNTVGYLALPISASDVGLALRVGDGAQFPTLSAGQFFYVTLSNSVDMEIMKCTARSGDSLMVTRAQESTTARSFPAGSKVEIRVTAQSISDAITIEAVTADEDWGYIV